MKITKKLNQLGMLHLHALIPLLLVVVAIGGIGAYVISKSHAASPCDVSATAVGCPTVSPTGVSSAVTDSSSCGVLYRDGNVYYSATGTSHSFSAAKDSDSIRNIAYELCVKGYLSAAEAAPINASGNYSTSLKTAYARWQSSLGYKSKDANGVPGRDSLQKLNLNPIGF